MRARSACIKGDLMTRPRRLYHDLDARNRSTNSGLHLLVFYPIGLE
jgi:hypothetical protein